MRCTLWESQRCNEWNSHVYFKAGDQVPGNRSGLHSDATKVDEDMNFVRIGGKDVLGPLRSTHIDHLGEGTRLQSSQEWFGLIPLL